jgi:glycerol-3-phosphate acyltransferase PlsY
LKAGIGVLLADFLKGMAATFIGLGIGGEIGGMIGGMAAILGHNWPIFLEFRGGKGIATSLGLIFTLFPRIGVILVILGVIIIILTRYVSLASLIGSIIFPILISIFNYDLVYIIGSIVISGLAIYRHRSNISRLLKGKENKISFNLKSR